MAYVGHNLAEPCVFANEFPKPLADRALVLFSSVDDRIYTLWLAGFSSTSLVSSNTLEMNARFRVLLSEFC